NILFDYRNWNTLAFRGRLMSLLAPARGMPTLSAKAGFSRPSSFRSVGSHRGLWDCDYSTHRKHFLPLESRVFQLLGWRFHSQELLYYSNSSNHNIYDCIVR